jgi:hypothetical protein
MRLALFKNIYSIMLARPLDSHHPLMEHQLHFVQSYLTPEIANEVTSCISLPG